MNEKKIALKELQDNGIQLGIKKITADFQFACSTTFKTFGNKQL